MKLDMHGTSQSITRRHQMRFGTEVSDSGARFKIWAPKIKMLRLRIKGRQSLLDLQRSDDGWHRIYVEGVKAGTQYKFVLPDGTELPDPASRYQPKDVHSFSEVVDPEAFSWSDAAWKGRPWEQAIIYELHVGTFTKEGTFAAATARLDHLVNLGITAIELMPIADFYGHFNWGYDGTMWFAPDASYGTPDDLKAFVDAAHRRSLMVFLDVVYNHFGATGNYWPAIAPIFTKKHESPWGEAINYDDSGATIVRELVVENALYWVSEFNLDGLRFDAIHTIADDSPSHILEVLAARVRAARPNRFTHLIVENSENQEHWLRRDSSLAPVHYTAQWNDDLHHLLHSAATGENTGYYADFEIPEARVDKLAWALAEGFAYQGQYKPDEGVHRGEPSLGLPPTAFVTYLQDHDQIGNRIKGDRITQLAHSDAVKALTALYLLLPQIPMLFMGEEWASTSPFPFFADVPIALRDIVREGRKEELKHTPEYDDPSKPNVESATDPTAKSTFESAKLDWQNLRKSEHRNWLAHYRSLIDIRKKEIIPRLAGVEGFASTYEVFGSKTVQVSWRLGDGSLLRLYANLSNETQPDAPTIQGRHLHLEGFLEERRLGPWTVLWTIEI